jgi:cytochrome P450
VHTYRRHLHLSHVHRLGSRAAVISFRLPFGIGFIYQFIKANSKYQALEFWQSLVTTACSKASTDNKSFTAEMYPPFSDRMILTTSSVNMKSILTRVHDFGKGPQFVKEWHDFLGRSIFVVDGDEWAHARKTARPGFAKAIFEDCTVLEKHTRRLFDLITDQRGEEFDLKPLLYKWTMDVSTDVLFGESIGCLAKGGDASGFETAFNEVEEHMAWRVRLQ